MDKFRKILKILFNIVMTIILYSMSIFIYYHSPDFFDSGYLPGNSILHNLTIGAITGFLELILISICSFVMIMAIVCIYAIINVISESIFDKIFPNKKFSDVELRDLKLILLGTALAIMIMYHLVFEWRII